VKTPEVNKPGVLAGLAEKLAKKGINIDCAYTTMPKRAKKAAAVRRTQVGARRVLTAGCRFHAANMSLIIVFAGCKPARRRKPHGGRGEFHSFSKSAN